MKRLSVTLTDAMYERLVAEAEAEQRSIASIIRLIITFSPLVGKEQQECLTSQVQQK